MSLFPSLSSLLGLNSHWDTYSSQVNLALGLCSHLPSCFPHVLSQLSLLPVDIFPVMKGMEFQCFLLEAFPNPF